MQTLRVCVRPAAKTQHQRNGNLPSERENCKSFLRSVRDRSGGLSRRGRDQRFANWRSPRLHPKTWGRVCRFDFARGGADSGMGRKSGGSLEHGRKSRDPEKFEVKSSSDILVIRIHKFGAIYRLPLWICAERIKSSASSFMIIMITGKSKSLNNPISP